MTKKQTIRLNESQFRQVVKESVKMVLNEMGRKHRIDGRTFDEWREEVKQELLANDCEQFAADDGFVDRLADFTWSTVEDGNANHLWFALDDYIYDIEEEYKAYKEHEKYMGIM